MKNYFGVFGVGKEQFEAFLKIAFEKKAVGILCLELFFAQTAGVFA
jgi:hypothetical protein